MKTFNPTLPDFDDSPVIETVLGVPFAPLERYSNAHGGLYWAKIREAYPQSDVRPPLIPVFEQVEGQHKLNPSVHVELGSAHNLRYWFIDPSETQFIQVQNDRFILDLPKGHGASSLSSL